MYANKQKVVKAQKINVRFTHTPTVSDDLGWLHSSQMASNENKKGKKSCNRLLPLLVKTH